eukprot:jgi/Bigna1/136140/aug1.32_g10848
MGRGNDLKREGTQPRRFQASLVRHPPSAEEIKATKDSRKLPFLVRVLGLDELVHSYLWKAVLIECFGMAFLTIVSIGAILSSFGRQPSSTVTPIIEPPALGVAVSHFFILGLMILTFAASSGGHLNPMISFATTLTGHTPAARGLLYIGAQMLGAVIGAQIMKDALPDDTINWTKNSRGQVK